VRLATRDGIIVASTAAIGERNVMLKLTVLYNHPEDPETFEDYYANERLPLAAKMPNVLRFESGRVGTVDGSEPPYYRIAELWFESAEQLSEALSSPEGEEATGDIRNFATGGATIFISEVEDA
jgi:uncharacterized protein (TIGR02118 family)